MARTRDPGDASAVEYRTPEPHPSGAGPPKLPGELVPKHVAIVMDGNGRWAKERGLPRTEGHKVGERRRPRRAQGRRRDRRQAHLALRLLHRELEALARRGALPDELQPRLHPQDAATSLDELGIRVRWVGPHAASCGSRWSRSSRSPRSRPTDNDALTLYLCVNYGGRAEIADAAQAHGRGRAAGRLDPSKVNEKTFAKYLYYPDMPDVDLFLRPSGEQRTSNYLIWQSAYAEMVFQDVLWPDFDRRDLWRACVEFAVAGPPVRRRLPNEVLRPEGSTPVQEPPEAARRISATGGVRPAARPARAAVAKRLELDRRPCEEQRRSAEDAVALEYEPASRMEEPSGWVLQERPGGLVAARPVFLARCRPGRGGRRSP